MTTFQEIYLDPLEERLDVRIDALEKRIGGIENKLNLVLKHLGLATEEPAVAARPANHVPPEAKSGPYEYRPLDATSDQIRLLAVYNSDNDDEPVACRLLTASITGKDAGALCEDHVTAFKTLSYAWGDPTATKTALIDGREFPVTQNLEAALKNIRKQNPRAGNQEQWAPTFWWIDAICINQRDIEERGQQVNLMTRIYRKAAGVHIWLGEETEDSDLAMGLARQLSDVAKQGPGVQDAVYPEVSEEQRTANWKALISLLDRSWWARVWVRQEVAVAKLAVVHCGGQQCEFSALAVTADILNKVDETLGSQSFLLSRTPLEASTGVLIASPYARASVLAGFRSGKGKSPNLAYRDFGDLIVHTRSCSATDVRDKVFSMLGLLDPTVWPLRADYNLSIQETLMSAARCIISKTQSLKIMAIAQNPQRLHGLASWAPNLIDGWSARPFAIPLPPNLGIVDAAAEAPDFTFEGEGGMVLKARGCMLDVVATLCPDTPGQDWSDDQLAELSAAWKSFIETAHGDKGDHMDRGVAKQYQADEGAWVRFMSGGTDTAMPTPATKIPLGLDSTHRYELVKSLLLKREESEVDSSPGFIHLKNRTLQALRKFGVGRRLCATEMGPNTGRVVMVPMDAEPGDEIWLFRGTKSPYVLRKTDGDHRIVVGEARKYSASNVYMPGEWRALTRMQIVLRTFFLTSIQIKCRLKPFRSSRSR